MCFAFENFWFFASHKKKNQKKVCEPVTGYASFCDRCVTCSSSGCTCQGDTTLETCLVLCEQAESCGAFDVDPNGCCVWNETEAAALPAALEADLFTDCHTYIPGSTHTQAVHSLHSLHSYTATQLHSYTATRT